VTQSVGFAGLWRSQQELVTWMLGTHHSRLGLTVRMLPAGEYASGKYILQEKEKIKNSVVKHYCWTLNMEAKIKLLIENEDLHVQEALIEDAHIGTHTSWQEMCTDQPAM
jgi:hypothetical protein